MKIYIFFYIDVVYIGRFVRRVTFSLRNTLIMSFQMGKGLIIAAFMKEMLQQTWLCKGFYILYWAVLYDEIVTITEKNKVT